MFYSLQASFWFLRKCREMIDMEKILEKIIVLRVKLNDTEVIYIFFIVFFSLVAEKV